MGKCVLKDGRVIQDFADPYIIAEVNSSHNGSMDIAKQMIDAAKEAGCDCVKFQSWTSSSLYSKSYYRQNPIAKRFVDKFALSSAQLSILADYCRSQEIGFSSTPYSREEVDFLADEAEAPFIKIASMELNNIEFLEYIGQKNVPVVLSTGMGELYEIKRAVQVLEENGCRDIAILHCVSIYPAELSRMNLNNIVGFREIFPQHAIGYSDHTLGDTAAVAAVALGAAVLEKHITLDSRKIGMDNQMAMEPEELKKFVRKCHNIHVALGSKERVVLADEYEQRNNMRRSIISVRDMKAGEILKKEDLDVKRPGTGIPPERLESLIGCRVLKDVEADTLIMEENIERLD